MNILDDKLDNWYLINSMDKYFFDKNVSAKVEYSKNWATGVLEDVSDVRLNKQHLGVSLAMSF